PRSYIRSRPSARSPAEAASAPALPPSTAGPRCPSSTTRTEIHLCTLHGLGRQHHEHCSTSSHARSPPSAVPRPDHDPDVDYHGDRTARGDQQLHLEPPPATAGPNPLYVGMRTLAE